VRFLEPLLKEIESLNERVKEYDERMEKIAKEVYPEVSLLKQVKGVGTQIALTYVLTIEDPHRFLKSRAVGCFLGLRPGRRNSGESEPQKGISKEGDRYLRTMMVQGAQLAVLLHRLWGLSPKRWEQRSVREAPGCGISHRTWPRKTRRWPIPGYDHLRTSR
jgi:transposase